MTPPPSGLYNITHIRLGGTTIELASYKLGITSGSGNQTCTLLSGFGSSYSNGQACTVLERVAKSPDSNVDLNQFVAPVFAAEALYSSSTTYANAAKALYVVTAGTPNDNDHGPQVSSGNQKQWDEQFVIGQHTLAYLSQGGF